MESSLSDLEMCLPVYYEIEHEKKGGKSNTIGYKHIQEPDAAAVPHGLMNK